METKSNLNFAVLRPSRMGEVLKAIADTYPLFSQTLLEQVQNSLDADAKNIEIFVNARMKLAYVTDNGNGVTLTEFNESLESLLEPKKGKDKFGRFARGKIAALTKCNEFTFHSRGKTGPAHCWTFHCKEILASVDFPKIPWETMVSSQQKPWWRTQVLMKGLFFNDAVKFRVNLSEIKANILSSFGTKMRKLNTVIKITHLDDKGIKHEECFSAKSYTGEALPVWVYDLATAAGKVTVRLYKSEESSPIPVTIGQTNDPFRMDWKSFYQSVNAFSSRNKQVTFDGKEIHALFRSGIVSGEIECENISIHSSREKFERNEALGYFIMILQEWFEKVGKKIYEAAEIHAKSSLYQQIAIEAVKRIENHPLVSQFLQHVRFGSTGKGHADTGAKELGTFTATDVNRGHDKGKGTYKPEDVSQKTTLPSEKVTRPKQVPILVAGDDGQERKIVRNESLGLVAEVLPFPGLDSLTAPLFRIELGAGKVVINQDTPDFGASRDRGVNALRRYIDMVLIAAMQSVISSDRERSMSDLEQYVRNMNQILLAGDQRTI